MRRRKFWGWGWQDEGPDPNVLAGAEALLPGLLGIDALRRRTPPELSEIELRGSRVLAPAPLAGLVTADAFERAAHTYGKSYRDLVRAFARDFEHAPDLVAFPTCEADVLSLLDWCSSTKMAVIPYGGGS